VALTRSSSDYCTVKVKDGAIRLPPGVELPHSYQVEFTTYDGRTLAVAKVSAAQIRPLGSKEIHHARAFEPTAR
jgi:hypothetical protein